MCLGKNRKPKEKHYVLGERRRKCKNRRLSRSMFAPGPRLSILAQHIVISHAHYANIGVHNNSLFIETLAAEDFLIPFRTLTVRSHVAGKIRFSPEIGRVISGLTKLRAIYFYVIYN